MIFNGLADYQISNVLAALAAARACGLPVARIVRGLLEYSGNTHNAGRANLYRVGVGYVMVDYGHNPVGFSSVGRLLRRLKASRLTAVVGVPGDRDDEVIKQAGRAAAQAFDRLILREDKDLRGRRSGEVARMLYRAAEEVAPKIPCSVVLDEQEALELALRELQEDEFVVIFYEKELSPVLALLERDSAVPVTAAGKSEQQGEKARLVVAG